MCVNQLKGHGFCDEKIMERQKCCGNPEWETENQVFEAWYYINSSQKEKLLHVYRDHLEFVFGCKNWQGRTCPRYASTWRPCGPSNMYIWLTKGIIRNRQTDDTKTIKLLVKQVMIPLDKQTVEVVQFLHPLYPLLMMALYNWYIDRLHSHHMPP